MILLLMETYIVEDGNMGYIIVHEEIPYYQDGDFIITQAEYKFWKQFLGSDIQPYTLEERVKNDIPITGYSEKWMIDYLRSVYEKRKAEREKECNGE